MVEGGTSTTLNLTVAVKVLKECAGVEAEADFLREVEIMSAFRHENILSLIGIVATGERERERFSELYSQVYTYIYTQK